MSDDEMESRRPLPRRIWWPWDQTATTVGFVRAFTAGEFAPALLSVAASGPYTTWLDDTALQTPDLPNPSWRVMHRIHVSVSAGPHVLRFEVAAGDHGQPFLLACLDWAEGVREERIGTDDTWWMAADPPAGWLPADLEAVGRPAWAFDGVWAEPWGMPCNAPDDFGRFSHGWQTTHTGPLPLIVELHQGLTTAGGAAALDPDGTIRLAPSRPHAAAPPRLANTRDRHLWEYVRDAQSIVLNSWLELFAARAPYAVFDAGEEAFGRLRITLRHGGPAILAVCTGESLPEVHRYAKRCTDIFTLQDGETFTTAPVGFRYVKLMALSAGGAEAVVEPLQIQHIEYGAAQVGSFRCSDTAITSIWALSARTVHLCMQNEVWDGIKRDQRAWMGDLYTEALVAYHLYDDPRLVRHTLAVLSELGPGPARPIEQQRYPGLVSAWKTKTGDINDIPSYTLWWIVGMADYLRYTGDRSLIDEVEANLAAALDHVTGWVGDDGLWRFRSGWDYVDWAPLTAAERERFCHLLACKAMAEGIDVLASIGRDRPAWRAVHARMVAAARQAWWQDGEDTLGPAHHLQAMAIRSGVLSDVEAALLFDRGLAADPPATMTYWHRYADLDAARRAGRVGWGLGYIRRHWGPALQIGMSTLWEAFDPAWIGDDPHAVSMIGAEYARYGGYETSLCHGWSGGPAAWLPEAVLGVRPLLAGYAAIEFTPELGDLQWAEGTIPTPRGPISVTLRRDGDRASAQLVLPAGIEPRIPAQTGATWEIEVQTR